MSSTGTHPEPASGAPSGQTGQTGARTRSTAWVPGNTAIFAGGLGVGLLALGLAISRPDVAVLGVPMVLGLAWGWLNRPRGVPHTELSPTSEAGRDGAARAIWQLSAGPGVAVVRLRVSTAGYQEAEAVVAAGPERSVPMSLRTARTGVLPVFRVDHISVGHDELLATEPARSGPLPLVVRPASRPMRSLPLPFRLQGLTGPHPSRRVGEGLELHDVHEFTPGDRLRRIDWKVSARRSLDTESGKLGQLYVRRTLANAEASVMLVVDSRDDVGPDVETWSGGSPTDMRHATSVDLAREATTSIAEHLLHRGDRVGLDDLGLRSRPLAPAAGRKHLERITQRLARIAPEGSPRPRQRSPQLSSGAMAVIFSTFLDDEAGTVAALWRSQGHRVIAVDVLPEVFTDRLDPFALASYRLIRLERGLRLADLRAQGVDLVHWVGDPDGHGTGAGVDESLLLAAAPRSRGGRG